MARIDDLDNWIQQNVDKRGTPEFVKNADEYRTLRAQERAAALPDINDVLAKRNAADPNNVDSVIGRVVTGAATGIPDLVIGAGNAMQRMRGEPEAPYLGQMALKAGGFAEMPKDASSTQQLLEGGGSALLGGGAGAIKSALERAPTLGRAVITSLGALGRGTVAPTVGAHYGGETGGYIADKLGLDPQTGALIGSVLGGTAAGKAYDAPAAITDWRYRGEGRDNAAEVAAAAARQGVTPTAGMLGNERIQARERELANKSGGSPYISTRRQGAINDIGAAWDRAAVARGSTDVDPTRGSIGYNVAEVGRTGAQDLGNISSRGQQTLMGQVGPRSDTDISGVLAAMERIRNQTDPGTAAPIDARIGTLRQMLPRDPQGNILSTDVPYERVKDWRTALRERSQNYDPVPGRFAGQIYDATTGAMRDAAVNQGVPGQRFDNAQQRTAAIMAEGGPHEQLTAVGGAEPSAAFSYLKGGEQNPQRLRMLQATGSPMMDRIFGDYLRLLGNQTINQHGARGPINLANRWDRMHPEAQDAIGGAQVPNINDVSTLARSFDYPTSQTGLGRTVGPLTQGVPGTLTAGEVGHAAGAATGIPGAATAGRILGYMTGPARRFFEARAQQSPTALNALAGGARPASTYGINDLVAAIDAANANQQQRRGPVR